MLVFIIHIRRYTLIFERCDIVLRLCLLRIAVQFLRDLPFILSFFTTRLFIPVQTLFFPCWFFFFIFRAHVEILGCSLLTAGSRYLDICAFFLSISFVCAEKKLYFYFKVKTFFYAFFYDRHVLFFFLSFYFCVQVGIPFWLKSGIVLLLLLLLLPFFFLAVDESFSR